MRGSILSALYDLFSTTLRKLPPQHRFLPDSHPKGQYIVSDKHFLALHEEVMKCIGCAYVKEGRRVVAMGALCKSEDALDDGR